jgi:O-antigen/teichoic acid export membrane protein
MTRPSASRVILNVLSTWGGQAILLALSFLFTPFIVHALGDAGYGVWLLMMSVTGFMQLLDLGVRGAVTRYIARFAAVGDHDSASRTASASLRIFLITAAIVTLISLALAVFALDLFSIPPEYRQAARIVLVLAGVNMAVSLIGGTYAGALASCNRIDLLNVTEVATGLIRMLLTVGAVAAGYGLVTMGVVHLLLGCARIVWIAAMLRDVYPSLRIRVAAGDVAHVRLIFSFSVFSFLTHVSGRFIWYTDALVVGAFLPVAFVTMFGIAGSLVEYARMLISSVSYATSPVASSLEGAGDHARIRTLLLNMSAVSMMILLPIAVTFFVRGASFIGLWMGPEYAAPSGRVLAILSLPLMFHAAAHGTNGIMLAIGKHKPMVPAMIIEAIANLAISVALVRTLGITGVAWGTAAPSLASSVLFWPAYISWATGLSVRRFLTVAWLRPALAVAPFTVATYVVEHAWPAQSLTVFLLQVALCTTLAVAGGWWLCLTSELRAAATAGVRRGFVALSSAAASVPLAMRGSNR